MSSFGDPSVHPIGLPTVEHPVQLTDLQTSMVLGVCPAGSRIVSAEHFRRKFLPAPIKVTARTPDGDARPVVIRLVRHGSVEDETRLLRVLSKLGLPVPEVLAESLVQPYFQTRFCQHNV